MRSCWPFALTLCLGIARAQTYSTGFESPAYTVGTLAGQNGWQSTGTPPADFTVTTAVAHSGTQSVMLDTSTISDTWAWVDLSSFNVAANPIVTTTVWVFLTNPNGASASDFGLDSYNSDDSLRLGFLAIDGTNAIIGGEDGS
ncbi:MAG TPA: hypothetical protein VMI31_15540, partial [Fimbriimonadaceae bacterium]|nr:hypothetical protein [Fimbriimonadaceae bacterium]